MFNNLQNKLSLHTTARWLGLVWVPHPSEVNNHPPPTIQTPRQPAHHPHPHGMLQYGNIINKNSQEYNLGTLWLRTTNCTTLHRPCAGSIHTDFGLQRRNLCFRLWEKVKRLVLKEPYICWQESSRAWCAYVQLHGHQICKINLEYKLELCGRESPKVLQTWLMQVDFVLR